jgi:FkbM family methyltransferase
MLVEMDLRNLKDKYNLKIKKIIQVGSHTVKEYDILKNLCKNFIFIDANPNVVSELRKKISKDDLVFENLLSDIDDQETNFYILNHEQSSSMLELDLHSKYHPEYSNIVDNIKLKTITLDSLIERNNVNIFEYNTLMIDVQGAEYLVLKGFKKNIKNIDYIYTELNFESMYKNCILEKDLTPYLSNLGFTLVEYFNTGFGWGDGLYIKNSLL